MRRCLDSWRVGLALAALWMAWAPGAYAIDGEPSTWPADRALPGSGVLGVLVLSQSESVIEELDARIRAELRAHTRHRLSDGLDARAQLDLFERCDKEPECFVRRMGERVAPLDRVLLVSLQQLEDRVVVSARSSDPVTARTLDSVVREADVGTSPQVVLREALAALFAEGWSDLGVLAFTSDSPGARIVVAGTSCLTPCRLESLPPGRYQAWVSQDGYRDAREVLEVEAGTLTTHHAVLKARRSVFRSPWFWTAVGAAAVAGGTAAGIAATQSSEGFDVRFGRDPS